LCAGAFRDCAGIFASFRRAFDDRDVEAESFRAGRVIGQGRFPDGYDTRNDRGGGEAGVR
jgi:hypothetical protein